jgi:hypothetical protein
MSHGFENKYPRDRINHSTFHTFLLHSLGRSHWSIAALFLRRTIACTPVDALLHLANGIQVRGSMTLHVRHLSEPIVKIKI